MTPEPISGKALSGEPALMMPEKSKYAGQEIDVTSRRSIEIEFEKIQNSVHSFELKEKISPEATHVVVNHFYHRETFWRAKIPLDGVEEVFGQCFNFSQMKMKQGKEGLETVFGKNGFPKRKYRFLNHLQSRFKLKADCPIELFAIDDRDCTIPLVEIYDFIYSLEAIGPLGVEYNVVDGLCGNLIAAHRVFSIEEMVFERIVVQNQYVIETQIPKLDTLQKRELLVRSLLKSHQAAMAERNYLLRLCKTNNCTSSPFQILDSVARYGFFQGLAAELYCFPVSPMFYLRIRGFVSTSSRQMLVRDEFQAYIQGSETQERKSAFLKRRSHAKRKERKKENIN
jgi:hypothetical protein